MIVYLFIYYPSLYNAQTLYHFPESKLDIILFFKSIFFVHFFETPINPIAWSLQNEFVFYTLFTFSLLLKINRILFFTIYAILIVVFNYYGYFVDNSFFKYLFQPIMLEFVLGVFLYKLFQIKLLKPGILSMQILFSLMVIFIFSKFDSYTVGQYNRVLTYGLFSFSLVYLFLINEQRLRFDKLFIFLGDASYSIYLSHWSLFTFSLVLIDYTSNIYIGFYMILYCISAISFGTFIYMFIEVPLVKYIKKNLKY